MSELRRSCISLTRNGTRCRMAPLRSADWCFTHHPAFREERATARSRGGVAAHAAQFAYLEVAWSDEDILTLLRASSKEEADALAQGTAALEKQDRWMWEPLEGPF